VNNFNIKYSDFLNEEQKTTFNEIVSMSTNEIENETKKLKKELLGKIDSLIKESNEDTLKEKLKIVVSEINNTDTTKFDYYKLLELKNNLV
jgi:gas vesicle protein